jgi:predicted transcriptional regulator
MRTTIRLDQDLMKKAKEVAAQSGRTLTDVIADALRESFSRRNAADQRTAVKLHTFKGGRVMPGVDLSNSAALLELMEETDAADGR